MNSTGGGEAGAEAGGLLRVHSIRRTYLETDAVELIWPKPCMLPVNSVAFSESLQV